MRLIVRVHAYRLIHAFDFFVLVGNFQLKLYEDVKGGFSVVYEIIKECNK